LFYYTLNETIKTSRLCFFTDGKQNKASELDMITLRNHALRSYTTWLPVTLTWLLYNLQLWSHMHWFQKFTVRFRPIRKETVSSMYNYVHYSVVPDHILQVRYMYQYENGISIFFAFLHYTLQLTIIIINMTMQPRKCLIMKLQYNIIYYTLYRFVMTNFALFFYY